VNLLGGAAHSWPELIDGLRAWAQEVKCETETADLWTQPEQVPEILAAQSQNASNAPFTLAEQAEIATRLDQVKQFVREQFDLTAEKLASIDQRLDDAKEAARHSRRKTWLYTFYGAVMSTFMTDEIPPHVIQTILATVLHGIGHILGIGGPPPVLTT
jgi:hypothetical protein